MTTKKHVTRMMAALALGATMAGCMGEVVDEAVGDDGASEESLLSSVVTTTEQETRIAQGWHMKTQATLHDDGALVGMTELRNSRSTRGYHGALIVALVDDQNQPLAFVPIDRWGIDACGFSCPRIREVTWSASVPSDEWARIGSSVRGMVLYHTHDPDSWVELIERIKKNWDTITS